MPAVASRKRGTGNHGTPTPLTMYVCQRRADLGLDYKQHRHNVEGAGG